MGVTIRLLAALLTGVLTFSACGSDDDPVTADRPTTTAAPTTATAEAPTTTSSQAPARLTNDSRLSFDGIGAVRPGMSRDEVEEAAGVPVERIELPACDALATMGDPTGLEFLFPGGGGLEFVFVREGSPVRTQSGISLGDSEQAVLDAHPGAEVINPDVEVHRIVVKESEDGRRLIFEIERGRVNVMWSGPNGSERADEICS